MAYQELFAKLDGLAAEYKEEMVKAVQKIREVAGETMVVSVVGSDVTEGGTFHETADERSIEADFRAAGRVLTPDLARKYADYIARDGEDDDGLFDAHVKVAALAKVDGVAEELDRQADRITKRWFNEYRVAVKGLTDERQAVYDEIRGMSPKPETIDILRPRVRTEESKNAQGKKFGTRFGHLVSDDDGEFPIGSLNELELEVLDIEMARPEFLAWYRNPSRPSADALAIAYQDRQDNWRRMCPDFVFFHGEDSNVEVSIVDPHGHHLGDALPKLLGLATFADTHVDDFHRVESIARMKDGTLRVLDFTVESVREAVRNAKDAEALYLEKATEYC